MIPFILRFAQQIPPSNSEAVRYNAQRQITQSLENCWWVDRLVKGGPAGDNTKYTKVKAETTDDE